MRCQRRQQFQLENLSASRRDMQPARKSFSCNSNALQARKTRWGGGLPAKEALEISSYLTTIAPIHCTFDIVWRRLTCGENYTVWRQVLSQTKQKMRFLNERTRKVHCELGGAKKRERNLSTQTSRNATNHVYIRASILSFVCHYQDIFAYFSLGGAVSRNGEWKGSWGREPF